MAFEAGASEAGGQTTKVLGNRIVDLYPGALGCQSFRRDYGLKYAYLSGAMYKGIGSKEIVVAMGKAGLMGYFGTGGLALDTVNEAIRFIKKELNEGQSYGMNLLHSPAEPELEMQTVELFLEHDVRFIEAAAYMQVTPALLRYRLTGIKRNPDGTIETPNRVLGKCSRPEVAEAFMRPAPSSIIDQLVEQGFLSGAQAELAKYVPVAQEICIEADSGGHTDQGNPYVLLPAMLSLRNRIREEEGYSDKQAIRLGAAGGLGTPYAIVASFMMGADFVLTGSINQCTVESGTSEAVKDILQRINVQDTDYAPAGDMFEIGAKVQVVKKGVFFPARANKLYELYLKHGSIEEIDGKTQKQIQERYFKRTFDEVWRETRNYYEKKYPEKIAAVEENGKQKMALVFRWYFVHTSRLALKGIEDQRVDYQIHCGPAMGSFNQWVAGTDLADWRNRKVADIAERLMKESARLLSKKITDLAK